MKTLALALVVAAISVTGLTLSSSVLAQAASAPASAALPAEAAPSAAGRSSAAPDDAMSGKAAWYGSKFNGRRTASGQRFNSSALTAAHPSLPFGSRVRVTNTKNNRSVVVVINDRGPTSPGRIIDVRRLPPNDWGSRAPVWST